MTTNAPDAILSALEPAPKCEWVTVPREPNLRQQNAGWAEVDKQGFATEDTEVAPIYRAMIAAAPVPPSADSAQDVGELVRALERTLAAIKTGRNEPLEIAREDITNVLAAYKRSTTDGKS